MAKTLKTYLLGKTTQLENIITSIEKLSIPFGYKTIQSRGPKVTIVVLLDQEGNLAFVSKKDPHSGDTIIDCLDNILQNILDNTEGVHFRSLHSHEHH